MKTVLLSVVIFLSSISFAIRESGGRNGASAVYVQFASYGTGVDLETQKHYESLVKVAKSQGIVLDETLIGRGREGETLNCVLLASAFDRYNFIKELAPSILEDNMSNQFERTYVYVGADCNDVRKATRQDLRGYVSK